jgi:histidyl-tRNA synthetase
VIVVVMEPSRLLDYQKVTRQLREAGVNTELYLGEERSLGKQLQYANRQGIPVAVIIGGDEFTRDEVTIKNLRLGGQLQDKKKTASGKDREEWLKQSRSVQTTVPRAGYLDAVRSTLATL